MRIFVLLLVIATIQIIVVHKVIAQQNDSTLAKELCSSNPVKFCPDTIIGITKYRNDTLRLRTFINVLLVKSNEVVTNASAMAHAINNVDDFLNIGDSSIFNSRYSDFVPEEIHPRNRKYYMLIKTVHELEELVISCERQVSDTSINKMMSASGVPRDAVLRILIESAKRDADTALNKLMNVNSFADVFEFLSTDQKRYYKSLKERFNSIYKKINNAK